MMRDLIAAFDAAALERMPGGWRRHRGGGLFTLSLGDGFAAWLGLNSATQHHPLQINPVVGLRCDPLERLVADLTARKSDPSITTLSSPIGYLTPQNAFLQLEVTAAEDVLPAVDRLVGLMELYGLPYARRHASLDMLLAALQEGGNVANPDRTKLLIPALLFLTGAHEQAEYTLQQGCDHYGDDLAILVVRQYREFAHALKLRMDDDMNGSCA
jgi:hypothetical protein